MKIENVKFNEDGLVPAIVQDAVSKEVLTLAYMNEESLKKSVETKETWFFSRSRQELWHKGATSGNTQRIVAMTYDCDADSIVVKVNPNGPACHTGAYSCFNENLLEDESASPQSGRFDIINELESVIAKREAEMPEGAYTTYLFDKGVDKILKKSVRKQAKLLLLPKTVIMKN